MSSYEEFSESSFDLSQASVKDEPPTLDETIYDINLFSRFLNYMKSQQCAPNLMFIKQVRILRMYNAPRKIWLQQAIKLIWTYFSECAPMPADVSPEIKQKFREISLNPEKEVELDRDSFSVAFGEAYNTVVPHYRDWLLTEEWREAVPFHRIVPPTFSIVLTSSTLRILFNKYIKAQLENDSDGVASHAYHLWKFCTFANDFRDGKFTPLSHADGKKKKKGGDAGEEASEEKPKKAEKEEGVVPEDYAKRLYKKYKHQVSLPYDGSIPYAVYIVRALDHAIEEFDKSTLFSRWIALKQYQGVDYQAKVVHQTLTKDGYTEPPTLAACLTSSMLPFFVVTLRGTEGALNLDFLTDVIKYTRKFDALEKSSSSVGSQSTDVSRKDMIEEAKRIFSKYLETREMYCDPSLVEEVRTAITKNGGKGVTAHTFRKCGAFIYQRSEHSWARQGRATILWSNRSYDNRSKSAHFVEEEFSLKALPEGMDLQIVPSLDDTLGCSALMRDYSEFCGKEINDAFNAYRSAYEEYFTAPLAKRKQLQVKVADGYAQLAKILPDLEQYSRTFAKEAASRDRLTDSLFSFLSITAVGAIAKKCYLPWLIEHSMKWKTEPWSPVPELLYSDYSTTFGMVFIEKKIEEAALKGKSGFSKYLAKRQVKKQAVANVRSAPAAELGEVSKNVFATKNAGDMLAFGELKGATELKAEMEDSSSFVVPTLMDTLVSPYLRNMFTEKHLSTALSATDMDLWNALCEFYRTYCEMDDDKLIESQDEMRSKIEKICDKYQSLLEKADEIKDRAKKAKFIFPHFFRPYEKDIYGELHTKYEEFLRSKGWN